MISRRKLVAFFSVAASVLTGKTLASDRALSKSANQVARDITDNPADWAGKAGAIGYDAGRRELRVSDGNSNGGYLIPSGSQAVISVTRISDLRTTSPEIPTVFCRGWQFENDGGGGFFIWRASEAASDDGGVVIALGDRKEIGRWVRHGVSGEIDVRWFGAKGDGQTDDSHAFQLCRNYAMKLARNEPSVASSPLGSIKIRVPAGTFLITEAGSLLDSNWSQTTLGLKYEGLSPGISAINFSPSQPGTLIFNNNALLFFRISGILFSCSDGHSTFYEGYSAGQAQDVRCDDVVWSGSWGHGFHLKGTNTNSEFKWNSCTISGGWDYFLDLNGNDQLLNYWFSNCKFWAWNGGGWIRAKAGGHIKITDCDVSAWKETGGRPLFALLGFNHARGVCHFLCIGTRFEISTDASPVLYSQWPHGVVAFVAADFGSQAPWRSLEYVESIVEIGAGGHAMIKWQDCTLVGRHSYRLAEGFKPLDNTPPAVVTATYIGCTHLLASQPDDMIKVDEELLNSRFAPHIKLNECRSERSADSRPRRPWVASRSWNAQESLVTDRQTVAFPLSSDNSSTLVSNFAAGSFITGIQVCRCIGTKFNPSGQLVIRGPSDVIPPSDVRPQRLAWSIEGGDYLLSVELSAIKKGTITISSHGGSIAGDVVLTKSGTHVSIANYAAEGRLELLLSADFDGKLETNLRRANSKHICTFSGFELQNAKTKKNGLDILVEDSNSGVFTASAQSLFIDGPVRRGAFAHLLFDFVA